MTRNNKLLIPFFLLVILGSVIVFLLSLELAQRLHYDNPLHYFIQHMIMVAVGIGVLFSMSKLENPKWFDWIGAVMLVTSLLMFALMLLGPESFSPFVNGRSIALKIGKVSIDPMLLFIIGALWLIDFVDRYYTRYLKNILWGIGFVWALILLLTTMLDMPMMILFSLTLLGIILYKVGYSKVFFFFLGAFMVTIIMFMIISPHRIQRIQHWFKVLTGESFYAPLSSLELTRSKLHEGVFAFVYTQWDAVVLSLLVGGFVWLIVLLWKYNSLFTKSISILLIVDVVFHLVNFIGFSPIKPPVLFVVEYGYTVTLISFVMFGMVLMRENYNNVYKIKKGK